jgi:hypothetical protein
MESIEVYWEVEGLLIYDIWTRLSLADGESFRFGRELDARAALDEFRKTGREARLVRVTREVVEAG